MRKLIFATTKKLDKNALSYDFKISFATVLTNISLLLLLFSCHSDNIEHEKKLTASNSSIKYAKGFSIDYKKDHKIITLINTWKNDQSTIKYVLYDQNKPLHIKDATFIKTPIKSIACMSLTHIAFIEKLKQTNSIVGLSDHKYVNSKIIRKRIANGFIKQIGQGEVINYEILINENPDILMSFGIDPSSQEKLNKFKKLGITVILNSEYMETHPLGKAEWIKFVAAFYNLEEKANSIFNEIETQYLSLQQLTQKVNDKRTVFTGMPWNGVWYVPGGKSYQAQLFKDAGANYLWSKNENTASIPKSKEIIIVDAYNADYWFNLDSYNNINQVINFDPKFKNFTSIKTAQLYNNNKRTNSLGGNDYWESGVINPHLILKDLISIFHPTLVEHQLYYYQKLRTK